MSRILSLIGSIHPFEDGNGRIARAITDLALAQAEHHAIRFYTVSAAIMQKRKDYYEILESTQRNGLDITRWLIWFLSILEISIQDAIKKNSMECFKSQILAAT